MRVSSREKRRTMGMLAVYEYRFKTDRVFVIDCLEYKRLEWSMEE